jgi:hypothetical protein
MHVPLNQMHDRGHGHGRGHGDNPNTNHTPSWKARIIDGGPIPPAISAVTYSNSPPSKTESTGPWAALPRHTDLWATCNGQQPICLTQLCSIMLTEMVAPMHWCGIAILMQRQANSTRFHTVPPFLWTSG